MKNGKILAVFVMLFALILPIWAESESELSAVMEKYFQAEAQYDLFSGAVLVARDGKIVFQGACGYADRERRIANTVDTKFNIGSVGKTFTGVLIMQLVQEGKIRLDDKLEKFLPDFPYPEKSKIEIRHLLNHTSGLGNYFSHENYEALIPKLREISQALKLVYDQKPLFEPGKEYRYSNSGMLVLGAVIEKVSGRRYRDYLRERILVPLGMKDSGIFYPEESVAGRAIGYTKKSENEYGVETWNEFPAFSAGGLRSTVGDMLKYERALRGNRLLSEESKKVMFTVNAPAKNYAQGWERGEFMGSDFYGHVGGCPGFAADFMMLDKDKAVVIVLSNYTDNSGMMAAKLRFLLFGDNKVPMATRYDYNFEKGRYLGEVKKDYRASIECLDRNITGPEPHLPSLFATASSRIRGKIEVEKAISLLERYLELNREASKNTVAAVWWFKGQGFELLEKFAKAVECYRKSLEFNPGFERARKALEELQKMRENVSPK